MDLHPSSMISRTDLAEIRRWREPFSVHVPAEPHNTRLQDKWRMADGECRRGRWMTVCRDSVVQDRLRRVRSYRCTRPRSQTASFDVHADMDDEQDRTEEEQEESVRWVGGWMDGVCVYALVIAYPGMHAPTQ